MPILAEWWVEFLSYVARLKCFEFDLPEFKLHKIFFKRIPYIIFYNCLNDILTIEHDWDDNKGQKTKVKPAASLETLFQKLSV